MVAFLAALKAEASRNKRSAQFDAIGPTAYAGPATGLLPAAPLLVLLQASVQTSHSA